MKTLIIIRHAKAEQGLGSDLFRKLTERGHRDAELMAKRLSEKGYRIDRIFSSPAIRTRQTTEHFVRVHRIPADHVNYFKALYLGDTLNYMETARWLRENVNTLAVVGHNPGVTNFTNDITRSHIENIPTSGIAIIRVACDIWEDFDRAPKTLVDVDYPSLVYGQ